MIAVVGSSNTEASDPAALPTFIAIENAESARDPVDGGDRVDEDASEAEQDLPADHRQGDLQDRQGVVAGEADVGNPEVLKKVVGVFVLTLAMRN
ncbi:MAG: hypothetical protein MZW92_12755, partial [Comamonadaceae bacterium]|nr:hypothetical protein [Comamonadaceae bacterium]